MPKNIKIKYGLTKLPGIAKIKRVQFFAPQCTLSGNAFHILINIIM